MSISYDRKKKNEAILKIQIIKIKLIYIISILTQI